MTRRRRAYFAAQPGEPPPLEETVKGRVKFSEVDAMAVVWHGNYPAVFELAHSELMFRIGLGFEEYRKCNVAAPIAQIHVDYHTPLVLDEEFSVTARLFWNDGARLDTAYTVCGPDGTLRATGYTVQMFVDILRREPLVLIPDIYENCRERWRRGEFN